MPGRPAPRDTLIIWKIDRLGRNPRDLVDIVATLEERGVGVKSLTNGTVDTTTAHGKLVFGMFALMAEYEAVLIKERTLADLTAARARGAMRDPETPGAASLPSSATIRRSG
jgi:DNA invertase Pin-like site-specific DNA recombinase